MSSWKNKQRILRILKYLYRHTDEKHPITNTDLVDMFTVGVASGTRKTIRNDLDVLNLEGFSILETKSHRDKCYYPGRLLDSSDVSLLINAVVSSRFISNERGNVLKEKLLNLVSVHEAATISQYMYALDTMKKRKTQLYLYMDLIEEAINNERRIKYQSIDYLPTKERDSKNNGEYYSLSPFAIICNEDRFFVLGYPEDTSVQSVKMIRIDNIVNVEITDEPAFKPGVFDIREYINKDIRINTAEETEVVLECANEQLQNVIDCFGVQIDPYLASEGRFYVSVRAEDSPAFYAWVFKAAGEIWIVEPKALLKKYRKMLRKGLNN